MGRGDGMEGCILRDLDNTTVALNAASAPTTAAPACPS